MAGKQRAFEDREGQLWKVELDALLLEEVKEKHQVDLANLEKDPLVKLRNDPATLVAIIFILCQEQIEDRGLSPKQFAKCLPSPPDSMLEAVADAIVNFFPSGRHSHVREVLTKSDEMLTKSDQIVAAQMTAFLENPKTMDRLNQKATRVVEEAMDEMFPLNSEPGT